MAQTYPKWQNFLGGTLDYDFPAAATVVTDGVTTNTSTTITSATAAFVSATDVGCTITGTGIPANATIASVTNSTTAVLSAAATATGTAITFTINRHLTMRSAALAAMVAVAADDYMKVVFDPDGLGGEPEIVYVSVHTAAATTATIVRAQEGTTARAHLQDVPWVHAVTARAIPTIKVTTRTAGDLTLNSTNWANVDTGMDVTLAAQIGDVLEASLSAFVGNEAVNVSFDAVTIVSAAPVNSFGKRGAVETTPGVNGVPGWRCISGVFGSIGAPAHYTVVSGDLASGLVTVRLRYSTGSATNKTFYAASASHTPEFCVKNLGA